MNTWDIYEITTNRTSIHGVMMRGRIRKFAIEQDIELLTENATDVENAVRYALLEPEASKEVGDFVMRLIPDANIEMVLEGVVNPVLSKLKVNNVERYEI